MKHRPWLILLIVAVLPGCAPRFSSWPAGYVARGGAAESEDIRVSAIATQDIQSICECSEVLGLQVSILNAGDNPVLIRYDHFSLRTRSGERLVALPPFDPAPARILIPRAYPYAWSGFHVAPHLAAYYRGFWNGSPAWPEHKAYYDANFPSLTALAPPTAAMQRHALPEGMLEPEGRITGLLYFRNVEEHSTLTARIAATDYSSSATFELPIRVDVRVGTR